MAQQPILPPGSLEAAIRNGNVDISGKELKSAAKEAEKVEKEAEKAAATTDTEDDSKSKSSK